MAEVFHSDMTLIRQITGTAESRIDVFAEDVDIQTKKEFFEITDDAGDVVKRHQTGQSAQMSIGKLFDSEIDFANGNNIKVYFGNILGTTTYQMGSCYITDKGFKISEDDEVTHNVSIVGRNFGTTS